MTIVIRITTLFVITVIAFSSLTATVEAQIFRRLRDNIRANSAPQRPVTPQPQRPYQVAPRPSQYGQTLTPYSRLTTEQRQASETAEVRSAEAPVAEKPTANSETVNVRIVTYHDPRTGRTFQRKFVLPPETKPSNGNRQIASRGSSPLGSNIAGPDRASSAAAPNENNSVLSQSAPAGSHSPQFSIPPLVAEPSGTRVDRTPAGLIRQPEMPLLAGPPIVAAKPAAASSAYSSPVVVRDEIRVDTSVAPAAATSENYNQPLQVSSAVETDDDSAIAYSVLETSDEDTASPNIEIEIDGTADVEAFFGSGE